MPDQEPQTGGVAERWEVTLYEYSDEYEVEAGHVDAHTLANSNARNGWFIPLAEAEALLGKARDRDEWKASRELQKACADALRAQAETLIDPNDPAVREALDRILIPGQQNHDDVVDRVLAALRGAK